MQDVQKARESFDRLRKDLYRGAEVPGCAVNNKADGLSYADSYMAGSLPLTLYKYQPYSERNLRDILCSRLHLAPIDKLNDVNEGHAKYSLGDLEQSVKSILPRISQENAPELYDMVRMVDTTASEEQIRSACEHFIQMVSEHHEEIGCAANMAYTEGLRSVDGFRRLSSFGSLCETPGSVSMWDRYADSHKGFVAAYEFTSLSLQCSCSRNDSCSSNISAFLFPVSYMDERPNMSKLLTGKLAMDVLNNLPDSLPNSLRRQKNGKPSTPGTNFDLAFSVYCLGHKAREWEHEREWRLVAQCDSEPPKYVLAKPKALYLGNQMEGSDMLRVAEVASILSIDLYRMALDLTSNDYSLNAKLVPTPQYQSAN